MTWRAWREQHRVPREPLQRVDEASRSRANLASEDPRRAYGHPVSASAYSGTPSGREQAEGSECEINRAAYSILRRPTALASPGCQPAPRSAGKSERRFGRKLLATQRRIAASRPKRYPLGTENARLGLAVKRVWPPGQCKPIKAAVYST